jgi:hypothetical protein
MKQILLVFLLVFSGLSVFSQSYRVKISFYGIKCDQQSYDDIFDTDGAGDEIFLALYMPSSANNWQMKLSRILGDMRKAGISQAGSASAFGGFKTGDLHRLNENWDFAPQGSKQIICDYYFRNDENCIILPTIWEADDGIYNTAFTEWQKVTSAMLKDNLFTDKIYNAVRTMDFSNAGSFNFLLPGRYYGLDEAYKNAFLSVSNRPGSRPIGIMSDFKTFSSQIWVVNPANAYAVSQFDFGFGKGILPVTYNEVSMGNNTYHGVYKILFKVETFGLPPSASTPAGPKPAPAPPPRPAPPPATPTTTNVPPPTTTLAVPAKKGMTVRPGNILPSPVLTTEILYGVWSGTKGYSNSNTGEVFSLKFTGNTCWLLSNDGSGVAVASGAYTITGSIFSAILIAPDNTKWEIKSATVNPAGSQMTGSWNFVTPTGLYKTGLWTMSKVSS